MKNLEARFRAGGAITPFAILTGAGAGNNFAGSVIAPALARAWDNTQTFAA